MSSAEDVVATVVVWSALTNSKGNEVQQVEQISARAAIVTPDITVRV